MDFIDISIPYITLGLNTGDDLKLVYKLDHIKFTTSSDKHIR